MSGDVQPNSTDPTHRLRGSMNAVVDQYRPRTDAWEAILDGVERGSAMPALSQAPYRPRSRRLLAVAAVVLILTGAGIVATSRTDRPAQVRTTTGQDPADAPDGNGWYVPQDLPEGWSLKRITETTTDQVCPCRSAVWRAQKTDTWVWFTTEAFPAGYDGSSALDEADIPKIDLGGGISALLPDSTEDGTWQLTWEADGRSYGITTLGVDRSRAAALGRAFVADSSRDTLPAPEQSMALSDEWDAEVDVPDVQLDVIYTAPSGNEVGYALRTVDHLVAMSPQYHAIRGGSLPGQALPLMRHEDKLVLSENRKVDYALYLGRWPGAVVRAPMYSETSPDGDVVPSQPEYEKLLSSLRPVTPAEWRAFARRAPSFDPKVVMFESVKALAAG